MDSRDSPVAGQATGMPGGRAASTGLVAGGCPTTSDQATAGEEAVAGQAEGREDDALEDRRAPAARAGRRHGLEVASQVAAGWND
ncbi:hypothetical protein ACWGH8_40105 [Nonomuraea muscovyensis]|uniref:Uncharacterized protein n=1 Tax=Nonomuraea muscovyensis TaxID=1124761 RepID=A0A7X0EWW1_9ACTN|nr:hypothetical protein [Nonomuraea muscovyensis]MBB6346953.1 hypothetical protein [Nonomuraea muscovyensis]